MKIFLINLEKRKDRLERFMSKIGNHLKNHELEVKKAVDGSSLNLKSDYLQKNVNPWNFKNLNDKSLRGVIGCCLSHIKIHKEIIDNDIEYALIFEDDAYTSLNSEDLNDLISNINLPEDFFIIYLNKFRKTKDKPNNFSLKKLDSGLGTTESYIISKKFAEHVYKHCKNNIGAIDVHMNHCYELSGGKGAYETIDEMFYQYDRKDSSIR